ncbi:MAG: efflux RND transporter periplasmic adaptor subunit [Porticoccaceae bacterium]
MKLSHSLLSASFLAAALLSLAACSKPDAPTGEAPPPEVGVYRVEARELTLTTDLPGRTVAYRRAEVRPQVNGIIEKRLFTEGSTVEQGQQLYQIDDAKYQAAHLRAQATLKNAQQLADRYRELKKTSAVSRQQFDDAVAALELAKAEAELARIDLAYTKVLSPLSGRIGRSAVTEGALVTNGQVEALATVQQLDPIYVDINQPAAELLRLHEDLRTGLIKQAGKDEATASLLLEDGRSYEHAGVLSFAEVSVDEGTGSVTMRAVFPNPDAKLLPGMFVRARLVSGQKENALLVPQQGVQRDPKGEPLVWVVNDKNIVEQRMVTTERTVGNQWLVTAGISSGDQVITEGLLRVRPGMKVTAAPATNIDTLMEFATTTASADKKPEAENDAGVN